MSVVLQQNDTAPDFAAGAYCSGLSAGANAGAIFRATKDATIGSGTGTITVNGGESSRRYVYVECDIPTGYDGAAGDWVIDLDVSAYTGTGGAEVTAVYVCRTNSSGVSQETLGSVTGLSDALSSPAPPATNQFTVNQASGTTFAAGDKAMIVFGLNNTNVMTAQVVELTHSGEVLAPGDIAAASRARGGIVAGIGVG